MNAIEKYEFDRLGYLVIKGMLTPAQVAALSVAIDELEEHALARIQAPPRKQAAWGHDYHADDEGPFCVVPATHKSNYKSPYSNNPDEEPGMIGLPVQAGDAILFSENLRHGGFTNRSPQTRKTLHLAMARTG